MPIYTYRCENCGVQFEKMQKFTDPTLTRCPECNKKTLRKVYTPVGIVFKGSGFYATDNRSPSGAPSAKNPGGSDKQEKLDKAERLAEKQAEKVSERPSEKPSEKPSESKAEATKPAESVSPAPASNSEKSDK
jgi:putative FmdB family regulatory protein